MPSLRLTSLPAALLAAVALVVVPAAALGIASAEPVAAPSASPTPTPAPSASCTLLCTTPTPSPKPVVTASPTPSPTASRTQAPQPQRTAAPAPAAPTQQPGSTQQPVTDDGTEVGGVLPATAVPRPTATAVDTKKAARSTGADRLATLISLVVVAAVLLGAGGAAGLYLTRQQEDAHE